LWSPCAPSYFSSSDMACGGCMSVVLRGCTVSVLSRLLTPGCAFRSFKSARSYPQTTIWISPLPPAVLFFPWPRRRAHSAAPLFAPPPAFRPPGTWAPSAASCARHSFASRNARRSTGKCAQTSAAGSANPVAGAQAGGCFVRFAASPCHMPCEVNAGTAAVHSAYPNRTRLACYTPPALRRLTSLPPSCALLSPAR
jgi:hypothetical protein